MVSGAFVASKAPEPEPLSEPIEPVDKDSECLGEVEKSSYFAVLTRLLAARAPPNNDQVSFSTRPPPPAM